MNTMNDTNIDFSSKSVNKKYSRKHERLSGLSSKDARVIEKKIRTEADKVRRSGRKRCRFLVDDFFGDDYDDGEVNEVIQIKLDRNSNPRIVRSYLQQRELDRHKDLVKQQQEDDYYRDQFNLLDQQQVDNDYYRDRLPKFVVDCSHNRPTTDLTLQQRVDNDYYRYNVPKFVVDCSYNRPITDLTLQQSNHNHRQDLVFEQQLEQARERDQEYQRKSEGLLTLREIFAEWGISANMTTGVDGDGWTIGIAIASEFARLRYDQFPKIRSPSVRVYNMKNPLVVNTIGKIIAQHLARNQRTLNI
jgi:hypothetical protein